MPDVWSKGRGEGVGTVAVRHNSVLTCAESGCRRITVRAWPAATFSRSATACGAPERVCHCTLEPRSALRSCESISSLSRSASITTGLPPSSAHQSAAEGTLQPALGSRLQKTPSVPRATSSVRSDKTAPPRQHVLQLPNTRHQNGHLSATVAPLLHSTPPASICR